MLPHELVTKLNECANTDFVSMRDWWFGVVSCATALVAIGLVCEAPELIHDLIPIVRRIVAKLRKLPVESSKHEAPDWVRVVAFFGWILIVVGVVGEQYAGTKVKDFDANIQECSDAKVREATIDAGDARDSAKTAHDEADAVKKETDELTTRLGRASNKLDDIEKAVLAQGPRWGLLNRGENDFIEALKPFAGQKATVVICGQDDTERFAFEQTPLDLLSKAEWKRGYQPWNGCPTMLTGGNEIYFVSAADTVKQWAMPYPCRAPCPAANEDKVALAGRALCDILRKLKISTQAWMESPPRSADDEQAFFRSRNFFANGTPGSPAELALREPTTIFFLVGPRPPEFGLKRSKPIKANHTQ